MALALVAAYVAFKSQLALAQAADSISDMFSGAALMWAVWQASIPADDDHPLGHNRAEPLAAVVVAVLAGVLGFEVLRAGVVAVATGSRLEMNWLLAVVFAGKVVFRGLVFWLASSRNVRKNPAIAALCVDARNDVLVSGLALIGLLFAWLGLPAVDAWLAIAIGVYVALSGVGLARENVGLLMGEAAPEKRTRELMRVARGVAGVSEVDDLIATWSGSTLHIQVDIAVSGQLSVDEGHRIAHAVEARLMEEEDVSQVIVHVNPARP